MIDSLYTTWQRIFFQHGSYVRSEYGGACILRLGDWEKSNRSVEFYPWLETDARLIEDTLREGIRYYAPATWKLGEMEPLDELKDGRTRQAAAQKVLKTFPRRTLQKHETFFRLRKGIPWGKQHEAGQYDAPPKDVVGSGRLDSPDFPVLYGSRDLEICVHECRVTMADDCHVATLQAERPLELLDLCAGPFDNDGPTLFESLYVAIQLIFAAEQHSYEIVRAIANAARDCGLQGIAYPSYFSSLSGGNRILNIGLFGHPVMDGCVTVTCVNRVVLERATYGTRLGPCLFA